MPKSLRCWRFNIVALLGIWVPSCSGSRPTATIAEGQLHPTGTSEKLRDSTSQTSPGSASAGEIARDHRSSVGFEQSDPDDELAGLLQELSAISAIRHARGDNDFTAKETLAKLDSIAEKVSEVKDLTDKLSPAAGKAIKDTEEYAEILNQTREAIEGARAGYTLAKEHIDEDTKSNKEARDAKVKEVNEYNQKIDELEKSRKQEAQQVSPSSETTSAASEKKPAEKKEDIMDKLKNAVDSKKGSDAIPDRKSIEGKIKELKGKAESAKKEGKK